MFEEISDEESEWSKQVNTYRTEHNMKLELIKTKSKNEIKNIIKLHDT